MLVVHSDGRLEDAGISDLPKYLGAGDGLVFNDTRVIPAALSGVRRARDSAGQDVQVDVNLVERLDDHSWLALARPGKRLREGDAIDLGPDFEARIIEKRPDGELVLGFNLSGDALVAALDRFGAMPIPPYIARRRAADQGDRSTYQTVYASNDAGSVAAPTAGLHFTPRLMAALDAVGIAQHYVRLHVGLGTFAPLKDSQLASGRLHAEWRQVTNETADRLNTLRAEGGRCVAVGTTALRTLESAATPDGMIKPVVGPTDIFLRPGYAFRATDALLTNFHLPRSSLFMLVCALMGTEVMQSAYAHAIRAAYRFYSYGDACLLLPQAAKRPPLRA